MEAIVIFKIHSKRFYKYLTSYLVIIIVTITILGAVVQQSFVRQLIEETENAQLSMLKQATDLMNMRIIEFERIAINISTNKQLLPYVLNDGGTATEEAISELRKFRVSNDLISELIYYPLYNNKEDNVYSSIASANFDIYFNYLCKNEAMDFNTVRSKITSLTDITVIPNQVIQLNMYKSNYLMFVYPVRPNTYNPSGIVIFLVEQKNITKMLNNIISKYNGQIYITDSDYQEIISVNLKNDQNSNITLDEIGISELKDGVTSKIINDEKYSIIKYTSDINSWNYTSLISTKELMSKVNSQRRFFSIAEIVLLVLGVAVAVFFSRKNYLPLQYLVKDIINKNVKSDHVIGDEYAYISNVISHISNENNLLARDKMLRDLLLGKIKLEEFYERSHIALNKTYICIAIFCIDDFDIVFESNLSKECNAIPSYLEKLSYQFGIDEAYSLEMTEGNNFALILNYNNPIPQDDYLQKIVYEAMLHYSNLMTFTVGVSNVYENNTVDTDINKIYKQAQTAVYYRMIKGKDTIITYAQIERSSKKNNYPKEYEQDLIRSLKQMSVDSIEKCIDNIILYAKTKVQTIEGIRHLCLGIANTVVTTITELNVDNSFIEKSESLLSIKPFEPVENFMARIKDFCINVCTVNTENTTGKNYLVSLAAKEYIHTHFTNPAISLEDIADHCNVSVSYLCRFFKEYNGTSPIQYLDSVRMENAKKLLRETDKTLKFVVTHSGYIDEANFIRKFKKAEGITPIKYRNVVNSMQSIL